MKGSGGHQSNNRTLTPATIRVSLCNEWIQGWFPSYLFKINPKSGGLLDRPKTPFSRSQRINVKNPYFDLPKIHNNLGKAKNLIPPYPFCLGEIAIQKAPTILVICF